MTFVLYTCEGYRVLIEFSEPHWSWRVEVFDHNDQRIAKG